MPWPAVMAQAADITGLDGMASLPEQLAEHTVFVAMLYGGVFVVGFILLTVFTVRVRSRPLDWSGPLERFAARPWVWCDAALVILSLALVQAAFALGMTFVEMPASDGSGRVERLILALQGVLFHWVCFGLLIGLMWRRGLRWGQTFGIGRSGLAGHAGWGVLVLLGVMPLIISYNIVAQLVMHWWGTEPQIQDVTRIISGASGWWARGYFVLLAVVVAPVVEEMLFRGVLLPAIAKVTGVRPALVLVGVLFSLVHGFYMPAAVIFFILSVAFSLAYIYRGSLVTPMVMHALFNGMTMLVLLRL